MDIRYILEHVDHTLLSQTATFREIIKLCDEAVEYKVASVCIPPSYVKRAKNYIADKMKICTVIGFPNGYSTKETKIFETQNALENGADEIDMVINIGLVKDKEYKSVYEEIRDIRNICDKKILKVIVETCLLENDEKIELCNIVTQSGADFIKTSTGFSKFGAKIEDIKLFVRNIGKNVKIKAAGGISSLEDAEKFLAAGATRLGSSKIINLAKSYI